MSRTSGRPWSIVAAVDPGAPAEVWIYDFIDEPGWGVSAKEFVDALAAVDADAIDLHVNSPGGDVFQAQAIYNALLRHPATITAYVDGVAASAASFVVLAADRVVMARNALYMIHEPWSAVVGGAADMRAQADVLDKITGTLIDIYEARSRLDRDDVAAAMAAETWYDADEALAAGFVDEVGAELKAAASFDLSRYGYRHVPTVALADEIVDRATALAITDDDDARLEAALDAIVARRDADARRDALLGDIDRLLTEPD